MILVQWIQKRETINFTPAQRQFQQDTLDAHNSYRLLHCVPPLTLDDTISQSAQIYADHLAQINTMVHSGNQTYGENLYMTESSQAIKTVKGGTEFTN